MHKETAGEEGVQRALVVFTTLFTVVVVLTLVAIVAIRYSETAVLIALFILVGVLLSFLLEVARLPRLV